MMLTDAFIRSYPAPEKKTLEISDSKASGLVIRITPKGHKSFVFRYKYSGTVKRFVIGNFQGVNLAKARTIAGDLQTDVKKGIDPLAEKQKKVNEPKNITFKELAEIFKTIQYPNYRASTKQFYGYVIDGKLVPALGKREIDKISKQEIIRLLDKIATNNGQTMANRTRSRLHHMFEFAISRNTIKENPVIGTKPYKGGENESERFYSVDEIRSIWNTADSLREPLRSYLKIITLTGQRRTETHNMQWDHLQYVKDPDYHGWIWIIPKEFAKSDRDHEVPLSDMAVEIIQALHKRAGDNPYVFASGSSGEIPFALKTIKRGIEDVRNHSDVKDFKLHDMRRTMATWLAKLGTPAEVVSKVLNHKTGGGGSLVTRIYNRYEYRNERQTALNKWSYQLTKIIEGDTETKIYKIG